MDNHRHPVSIMSRNKYKTVTRILLIIITAVLFGPESLSGATTGFLNGTAVSTFLGGSANEGNFRQMSIVRDGAGNIYIAGQTNSSDFPVTPGAWDVDHNGNYDVFIAKFDPDLTTCLASTFLGGTYRDGGVRGAPLLHLSSDGSLYIAGQTRSFDFPATLGAYSETFAGGDDLFVAHFDADLTTLIACTFLGGGKLDSCSAIQQADNGDIFVSGYTKSTDYPVTAGAFQTVYGGHTGNWGGDIMLSCLSPDLTQLKASTYVGGAKWEIDAPMELDADGNIYVTGTTASDDFPVTAGAYQTTYQPGTAGFGAEAFIFKMNPQLDTLLISTFLGGTLDDWGYTLLLGQNGGVYCAGHTSSQDFPMLPGSYDPTYNGIAGVDKGDDLYIARLDATLSVLEASTYIGGSLWDMPDCLTQTAGGDLIVAGQVGSDDYPSTSGAFQETSGGGEYAWGGEAVIARFDADLQSLKASTYVGGKFQECIGDIELDGSGALYVTGITNSTNFPVTAGAYDTTYNGSGAGFEVGDAYLMRIPSDLSGLITMTTSAGEISASLGGSVDFSLDAGTDHATRNYLVLGSLSGTTPGFALPGDMVTAPLNWDGFTDTLLLLLGTPVFTGFYGALDNTGAATARIDTAPVSPAFVGSIMHYAFVLNNPFDFVSNSAAVEIAP